MESQVIFDKNSIEFVTVAAEYCLFIERNDIKDSKEFVDISLKMLPLLYLKASLIPECEQIGEFNPETFVTEDDYEFVRAKINRILAQKDDYLDVFIEDMKYSDRPIKRSISEDLADIYQDLKDFISVFQLGFNITMNDSLFICKEHFAEYWGQRLVNAMKALHDIKFNNNSDDDYLYEEEENNLL